MAFNMGAYQSAVTTNSDINENKMDALKSASENQAKTEEFKFDETMAFQKKAAKAAKKFGNFKSLGSLAGMAGAMLIPGIGPLLAAGIAAGGTAVGGYVGKNQAKKELDGRFFKGNQEAALQSMDKSILTDSIMSGIMGGVGAGAGGGTSTKALELGGGRASTFFGNIAGTKGGLGMMGGKTLLDASGLTDNDMDWSGTGSR